MGSAWRVRLLTAVLAAVSGACDDEGNESRLVCYQPAHTLGEVGTTMPALPCLARDDARLQALNPGCTTDFAVTSGPEQRDTSEGQPMCCYGVRYNTVSGCAVGRPLRSGDALLVAALTSRRDWGG